METEFLTGDMDGHRKVRGSRSVQLDVVLREDIQEVVWGQFLIGTPPDMVLLGALVEMLKELTIQCQDRHHR